MRSPDDHTDDADARLRAFADDPDNPPAKRAEARAAITYYEERVADIERRSKLTVTVTPLGMLLRVPEDR